MTMRMQRVMAAVILAVVFGSGLGAGVGLDRWRSSRQAGLMIPPACSGPSPLPVEMLQRRLGLSAEQTAKIQGILNEQNEQMAAIRSVNRPKMLALIEQARARVREILTPIQAEQFDQMAQERP